MNSGCTPHGKPLHWGGPTGGAEEARVSTSDATELLNAGIVMIASLKGKRREALPNFAPWGFT